MRLTQPFMLRLKTDKTIISDLPDKQEMKVWCNLTPEQASLYAATVTDMLSRIEDAADDISRRGLVLATMAKLKQVCNHPAHLLGDGSRLPGRSGKLARLEEICDEIVAEGDKALCFTQYAEFGRMLQPHLAARLGCPVLFLHGGTTKKQRDGDELLTALRQIQGAGGVSQPDTPAGTSRAALDVSAPPPAECLDGFWSPGLSPSRLRMLAATPGSVTPDLLLRMFPPPPVQVRGKDLADVLAPAYRQLAADDPDPGELP